MVLDDIFERFARQSPVTVMARAALEHALDPRAIDALFEDFAERQYTRKLLFSQVVDLMGTVVCTVSPPSTPPSGRTPRPSASRSGPSLWVDLGGCPSRPPADPYSRN